MKKWPHFLIFCIILFAHAGYAQTVPRIVYALYDSRYEASPRTGLVHRFLEMPANHLGLDVHYVDVNQPLPKFDDKIAGVFIWFNRGLEVADLKALLIWLNNGLDQHKKIVIIHNMGIDEKYRADENIMRDVNTMLHRIGVHDDNRWNGITYPSKLVYKDSAIFGFERDITTVIPPFIASRAVGDGVSHFKVIGTTEDEHASDLVITSSKGGFVSLGYAAYHLTDENALQGHQWYINPFAFLRRIFATDNVPKPDATTHLGKRIFYSHIDGDGWNNVSEIKRYGTKSTISAEVVRQEILSPYKDFAFNVGLITAEVDPKCYGLIHSADVARAIFALPNVEPSSHTHSHPLFWRFFANYTPSKEKPYLSHYPPPPRTRESLWRALSNYVADPWSENMPAGADAPPLKLGSNDPSDSEVLSGTYDTPRSYACTPFDLQTEVKGSIELINRLSPPNKKVKLVQWSGDTRPYPTAIKQAREAGAYNINGGDSRFDSEFPSYSSVAPIGFTQEGETQIYSSNSNENTYTKLWTDRFFGFRYLQATVHNTDSPVRVNPFNIYFHIFSGQKDASLAAVKENLEFARTQDIIPLTTNNYAAIANGFYTITITQIDKDAWQVTDRGAMNTIRFDFSADKTIDFSRSVGVMGERYLQGSLYVALDPAVENAQISLKTLPRVGRYPAESHGYIVSSRWDIKRLTLSKNTLTFTAQGYGRADMQWQMPSPGNVQVKVQRGDAVLHDETASTDSNGMLTIPLQDVSAIDPVTVTLETL